MCYQFFADDVGIFIPESESAFWEVQRVLECYEVASGARLNLFKSIIIPFSIPIIPRWLVDTGCLINKQGEDHRYLGAPFSFELCSEQLHSFCLDEIVKDCQIGLRSCCLSQVD